jgi:SAM-dependent methyltransferase
MDLRERTANERRHPWELARARFFRRLIARYVDPSAIRHVLDVGAGDGWFAHELLPDLPPDTEVICWDVNYRSEDLATPLGDGIRRTAERPPGPFDLLLLLDVLEHVTDDAAFLADEIVPALARRGIAVVSVPAHPRLFSDHDRTLEHRRRYRPAELRALLAEHLDVAASGSIFSTLLVPRAASVVVERAGHHPERPGVGTWSRGPTLTRALTAVLDADVAVGSRLATLGVRVPGLSAWAVCRSRRVP